MHQADQHPAPLDPNFTGAGRCLTDDEGRYRFVTVKPGAYPWRNHYNAWRPAHIHFSLFGRAFAQRLVTQMYFPGDPLLALDPIFSPSATPRHAGGWSARSTSRRRSPNGRSPTASTSSCAAPRRPRWRTETGLPLTPSQTVGPFFSFGLVDGRIGPELVAARPLPARSGFAAGSSTARTSPCPTPWWRSGRPDAAGDSATGLARSGTDEEGWFEFVTVKPARVPEPEGALQAPHVDVGVFARGLLKRLVTRLYFPDEDEANERDPVLAALEPGDRASLVASEEDGILRFDIRLQGDRQTTFLAL